MNKASNSNRHAPTTRHSTLPRVQMRAEHTTQSRGHLGAPVGARSREDERTRPRTQARPSYKETRAQREKHSLATQIAQLTGIIQGIFSRKLLLAVLVLFLVVVNLVGPVHEFYIARRTGDILQEKKELIDKKNKDLEASRDELLTEEGITNEARRRGYVAPGEVGVSVEGAEPTSTENPGSVVEYEDTRGWLQKSIDDVFGFNPQDVWDK